MRSRPCSRMAARKAEIGVGQLMMKDLCTECFRYGPAVVQRVGQTSAVDHCNRIEVPAMGTSAHSACRGVLVQMLLRTARIDDIQFDSVDVLAS